MADADKIGETLQWMCTYSIVSNNTVTLCVIDSNKSLWQFYSDIQIGYWNC